MQRTLEYLLLVPFINEELRYRRSRSEVSTPFGRVVTLRPLAPEHRPRGLRTNRRGISALVADHDPG